ncbi:esterase-like activity of phytase family protein [Planosporangium flavigriseum]|uniref:esterase-like activity of phytase family protein n=1 Tax=Planosporangium flavigriseum TaxID=373681 RepID=UPI00143BB71A|nr:esterase-like activity of phytase family protein [Planosporangium flavigriseum]NJC63996.1 esterase-like activity of phytase family protein [Planosporangium flavigriseum]
MSGLTAKSDGGYVVVNTSPNQANPVRVYYLDSKCKVTRTVSYPASPRDPEDLAVASDGTVWVADTGDPSTNKADRRATIALWKVPAGGGTPIIHRLSYPDGAHDARALLFGPDDVPIIVTKEAGGTAQIYEPSAPLQPRTAQGVPLKNVGSWQPKRTGTANFLGAAGQILVTGAAQSPDRKRVVLRTYSDAYEWDVPDGDVVKAITTGKPRITPLTGEAQGEGIAYTADGKSFLTCASQNGPSKILRYQPVSAAAAQVPAAAGSTGNKADNRPWYQKLSLPQIINIVAGVGVLGLVLVVAGVIGIRRSRKARRNAVDEGPSSQPGKGAQASVSGTGGQAGVPGKGSGGQGPAPAGAPVPADPRSPGRATIAPHAEQQRQGRATAAPADGRRPGRATVAPHAEQQRQGRGAVPPASPQRGGPAQPGRGGGGGGGNVYGGGRPQSGYDQRGGRQEYAQPGYRPEYDGDGRYFSERI